MSRITQLSPTPGTVITLGHTSNVPLIRAPSELSDGLEPHALIYSADMTRAAVTPSRSCTRWGGGVPGGGAAVWVPGGSIPGTDPAADVEAYLMNIRGQSVHTAV